MNRLVKAQEQSFTVVVEGTPITVTRKRVKNINFRIGSDGKALMSVPWHVSKDRATEIARDHADWFASRMHKMELAKQAFPMRWESGERIRVWGDELVLELRETDDVPRIVRKGRLLVVDVPANSTERGRKEFVERWLVEQLRDRLRELVPVCEERVGAHARSYTLRRMKSRWGSCTSSKRTIRLNTALAECPPDCLEMVLVHELCHIHEPNHGPRFHALMDLHCPSWRVWQRWLNEHPPRA